MSEAVEETFETEVRRKTVRTSYKIEEVSKIHFYFQLENKNKVT